MHGTVLHRDSAHRGDLCVQASNRLVRPHMHAVACAVAPELRSGFHGLADGAAATLDSLLDLHDELLERVPDRATAAATEPPAEAVMGKTGKKRGRDGAAGDELLSGEHLSPPATVPCRSSEPIAGPWVIRCDVSLTQSPTKDTMLYLSRGLQCSCQYGLCRRHLLSVRC